MCLVFVFVSCKKSAENVSANSNSASSRDESTTAAQGLAFTFDKNAQGWTVTAGATINYVSSTGHPAGCIRGVDNGSSGFWYFVAPDAFLQAIRSIVIPGNYKLKFDLKAPSTQNTNRPDVIIVSPDFTLVTNIPNDPNSTTWTTYNVPFTIAGNWKKGTLNGPAATNGEIKKALHYVQKVWIRGEFSTVTGNAGLLDNVLATNL